MAQPTTPFRARWTGRLRPGAVVGALVLASLLLATPVSAHAELATVTPADGASVTSPPAEIVMAFTEPLDPAKSSIKLVDTNGRVVVEGSSVDAADAKTMRLPVPAGLAVGTYTVRWISASALDGDLDHGTTMFTYAIGPEPESAAPSGLPAASAGVSAGPSLAPASVAPSPIASATPASPATSVGDADVPVVVAIVVLTGLGAWLLRGRARGAR